MSYFAGIDYDSETVFLALVDEQDGTLAGIGRYDLKAGPGDSFDRVRRLRDLMPSRGAWKASGIIALGLEELRSHYRGGIQALARVEGAILACLPRDLEVIRVSVNRRDVGWKALTVGKTNASKEEVADWAKANGAPPGLPEDLYDAFAIARAIKTTHESRRRAAA